MAVEAPLSKYKRNTLIGIIFVLVFFAAYCIYDGFFSKKFIEKYTDEDGNPESTLVFNQKAPPYLFGVAVLVGAYLFVIKGKKLIADENELIIDGKESIAYDTIQSIDKTHFKSKGFFVITIESEQGGQSKRRFNDRAYDNLEAVLEKLVAKIS